MSRGDRVGIKGQLHACGTRYGVAPRRQRVVSTGFCRFEPVSSLRRKPAKSRQINGRAADG
jgi:hypothetical protein